VREPSEQGNAAIHAAWTKQGQRAVAALHDGSQHREARRSASNESLNGLHRLACVHLCVTLRQTESGVSQRFLEDLEQSVGEARRATSSTPGLAPVYGLAATLPPATGALLPSDSGTGDKARSSEDELTSPDLGLRHECVLPSVKARQLDSWPRRTVGPWARRMERKKPVGQEELDIGVADTSTVCDVPRTSSAPPPRRRCSSIVHEDRFRTLGRQEALLVWIRDSELMCSGQSRCGRSAEGTLSGPLVPSPRQIVSGTYEDTTSGNRGCDTSNLRT
jgi:hypothetical protein